MANPLLDIKNFPHFEQIKPEHMKAAIDKVLTQNREQLQTITETQDHNWQSLMYSLEEMDDRLDQAFSPISHLNSVKNSDAIREQYEQCLAGIVAYGTELGQNQDLFQAIQAYSNSEEFKSLDFAQQKIVRDALRDFRRAGVNLPDAQKQKFKEIKDQLQQLTTKFSQNIMDATEAWHLHITDAAALTGIPEDAVYQAKKLAEEKNIDGWAFSLEFPAYYAVITYAEDRNIRQQMYQAFSTRASDQGPNAGEFDNTKLMEQILQLRHELAQLLGFKNFAEYSIEPKMAKTTDEVLKFLHDLAARSTDLAVTELAELKEFAADQLELQELNAWDIAFASENFRKHKFDISEEALRPYFPTDKVLEGMFALVNRLYGINLKEIKDFESWHEDVRFFEIQDKDNQPQAYIYMDLYARPKKRGGAWMDDCKSRFRYADDRLQLPVAYLTCNFAPKTDDKPALLKHSEVETLFHEFGHCLHHTLTQIEYLSVSGISGVEWDAVELPSQFMENWCWHEESIAMFSGHYETGATLPNTEIDKLKAAKHFQTGMAMVRQLEFSLFDFRIHMEFDPKVQNQIQQILDDVRQQVAVLIPPEFNRFQHSFSHIFAGGYAAGYYSYKWAEVLSSDAFSLFEEKGIFDRATGEKFLQSILAMGGSRDAIDSFVEFRGREPSIDALLRHTGIA